MTADGYVVSSAGDENQSKTDLIMVVQLHKYTKNHWLVHFKLVNCMVCELCINKAAVYKKKECFLAVQLSTLVIAEMWGVRTGRAESMTPKSWQLLRRRGKTGGRGVFFVFLFAFVCLFMRKASFET